jgi:hypothetical protein
MPKLYVVFALSLVCLAVWANICLAGPSPSPLKPLLSGLAPPEQALDVGEL